jgi:hypothetical protein
MVAILDTGRQWRTQFPIMQIRKKGGWNLKKIFSSETTEPISTKLCWNDPLMVPFQKCVCQRRPVSKMATITQESFQQSLVEIG